MKSRKNDLDRLFDPEGFPTEDSVRSFVPANLLACLGYHCLKRFLADPGNLRTAETNLAAVACLDGEVNNGGFAQWLYQTPPALIAVTPAALTTIGSIELATVTNEVLQCLPYEVSKHSPEEWEALLDCLPDETHLVIENRFQSFMELYDDFHANGCRYARQMWREVERPSR